MRRSDLLMLALSSLLGRKVRTALSVLGVAVGGFALVASLAIGQGVEATLLDQLRRQDQLRRIIVWPGTGPRAGTASGRPSVGVSSPHRGRSTPRE